MVWGAHVARVCLGPGLFRRLNDEGGDSESSGTENAATIVENIRLKFDRTVEYE